ncbi:MAG: DUF1987 domain-containing protein [Bacteroidales bacterium]|nr:DUF1987 domain-containing protein [Bacteroidales bacterium]
MEDLIINKFRNGNEIFPFINLNANSGVCTISGSSYMQDPRMFFKPIIDWFKKFTFLKAGKLVVVYNLKSLNTGTSRVLYEILEILKEYKNRGGSVYIKWYYEDSYESYADDIIDITSGFGIDVDVLES